MKKITKLSAVLLFSTTVFFTSCSEDEILEQLTGGCVSITAIESYSNALERYSNDPTVQNCEALKTASMNYLNALGDCPFVEDEDLRDALQDASESNCQD